MRASKGGFLKIYNHIWLLPPVKKHLVVAMNETFVVPLRTSVDECKDRSSGAKASNIRYFGSRDGLLTELEFDVTTGIRDFAECRTLCRVPSVMSWFTECRTLGTGELSAKTCLPSVKHSAKMTLGKGPSMAVIKLTVVSLCRGLRVSTRQRTLYRVSSLDTRQSIFLFF
jgi:hypothetical protein